MPQFVHDEPLIVDAAAAIFTAQKLGTVLQHCTITGAASDTVFGILQETVSAADVTLGRACAVRVIGVSRCIASAAIAIGARVVPTTAGKLVTAPGATANQNQVGIAMSAAAADGDHFDVLLTPGVRLTTP
jgi:hypothetical protein